MSFNKVILLGNLTRDPRLSYTPNQTSVVDFGLATNRRWKGTDGSDREEVCFLDCRAFGKLAENINKFFTKGKPIFLEGRLTFDCSWSTQDGSKKSKLLVTVENFQFLPGTGGAAQPQEPDEPPPQRVENTPPPQRNPEPIPDSDCPF